MLVWPNDSLGTKSMVSYPQNADIDDLPFEYDQMFFTKWPIDYLNNIIVKGLKVSLTKQFFDNLIRVINPQNAHFDDLLFDCDERFIAIRLMYCINDNIVERLNNGSIFDMYKKLIVRRINI